MAGPNLTGPGRWVAERLHLPVLVGPYVLSLVAVLLAGLVLLVALRPDPLLEARRRAGLEAQAWGPSHLDQRASGRRGGEAGDGLV